MTRNWLNEYTKISKGDGYHFERFISDLYSEYYDVDVKLNGKTNDKGVDLIIDNSIGIQAKYYSTSLGIKPIQEIHSGIDYYDLSQGIVITNSSYNSNAIDFADKVGIKLIDGNDLLVMINRLSMGKRAPEVEKKKSMLKAKHAEQIEINTIKDNQFVEYRTKKLYSKEGKADEFNKKINKYNTSEMGRKLLLLSLEQLYELSNEDELLLKQVFGKLNIYQVFEIDTYEKRTKIQILTAENKLNPQLKEAEFLFPPVGNQIEKYLSILESNGTVDEKIKKIKKYQIIHIITVFLIILIFIVTVFLLYKIIFL